MSYCPCNKTDCSACQARGTGNRYAHLYSQGGKHVEAGATCSALEFTTITYSRTETRLIAHVPSSNSRVNTPVEPRQPKCEERTLDIGNAPLKERNPDSYYPAPNHPKLPNNGSDHLSPRLRARQLSNPPYSHHDLPISGEHCAGDSMSYGCGFLPRSTPRPDGKTNRAPRQSPELIKPPEPDVNLGDSEDPENVQGEIMGTLWLDRYVESNGLPFVLQAYATWISRFLFEPLRIVQVARDGIFRDYALGEESRRIIHLIANTVYEITRSADYNPVNSPSFSITEVLFKKRFIEAGAHTKSSRELDRQYALGAMLNMYEFTSGMCKVRSLSNVLSLMQLAAPVFRRACPHSLDGLINLPTLFATESMHLQYYTFIDILLGVMTGRPMFFRYDVEFSPQAPESLFLLEDGPGMRWSNGIPDRTLFALAEMNALFEDFGPSIRKDVADRLEVGIKLMRPIVGVSAEPLLSIGRTLIQECWFLAALIYLYMGLCGADSTDSRVVKVRAKFMRILVSIRPKRHPDSFLVFPMVILGVATDDLNEQNIIRQRMLGVSECSRPGTMENDLVRILDNIWSKRRPTVWSDLRQGCWEVSGW